MGNIVIHDTPWQHGTIDYTYDQTLFSLARQEIEQELLNPYYKTARCPITLFLDNKREADKFPNIMKCIKSVDLFDLHETTSKMIVEKRDVAGKKLTKMETINISINYFPHDIHHETPSKLFSLVTYLSPDNDQGTCLYSEQAESAREKIIEWKPNRSMFFYGINDKTWHSYIAGDQYRVTINRFLVMK